LTENEFFENERLKMNRRKSLIMKKMKAVTVFKETAHMLEG